MKQAAIFLILILAMANAHGQKIVYDVIKSDTLGMPPPKEEEKAPRFIIIDDRYYGPFFGDCQSYQCSVDSLYNYLQQNVNYPDSAYSAGIGGRVTIGFCINQQGEVVEVRIVEGSGSADIDAEGLRVISAMPNWRVNHSIPKHKRTLKMYYEIPLVFIHTDKAVKNNRKTRTKKQSAKRDW